jgi:transposase
MGKEEGALLEPMRTARVYAGVDVSKDRLDVCVRRSEPERHGGGDAFVVAHDAAGIDTLVSGLLEEHPELVIVEATGGFERAVVAALAAVGLPVAVVTTLARCATSPGLQASSLRPMP